MNWKEPVVSVSGGLEEGNEGLKTAYRRCDSRESSKSTDRGNYGKGLEENFQRKCLLRKDWCQNFYRKHSWDIGKHTTHIEVHSDFESICT